MSNVTPLTPEVLKQKLLIESFNTAAENIDKLEIVRMRNMNEQAKYRHLNAITKLIVADIPCEGKHKDAFENAVGNVLLRLLEHVEPLPKDDVTAHQQFREAVKPMIVRELTNTAVKQKLLPEIFLQPS